MRAVLELRTRVGACVLTLTWAACSGLDSDRQGPFGPEADRFLDGGAPSTDASGQPQSHSGPGSDCVVLGPEARMLRVSTPYIRQAIQQVFGASVEPRLPPDQQLGPFSINRTLPPSELTLEGIGRTGGKAADRVTATLSERLPCAGLTRDRACARQFLQQVLPRWFRRAVGREELEAWTLLYDAEAERAGFDRGMSALVEGLIQAPSFLYLEEPRLGEELDSFQVAAHLARFIYRSVPDEALVQAAAAGRLRSRPQVEAQARRMLSDPRADQSIAQFFRQLLRLQEDSLKNRRAGLPNPEAPTALMQAFDAFVVDAFRSGDARELFRSTRVRALPAVVALYDLDAPPTQDWTNAEGRPGLFSRAWFLAQHAGEVEASLVRRGAVIRENLLCAPIPEPPPDANSTDEVSNGQSRLERMQSRLQDEDCAACHQLMDPIGVALDGFDAWGRARVAPEGDRGELVRTDVDGPVRGVRELSEALADSRQVQRCLVRQSLRFALGVERVEACLEHAMTAEFERSGFDLSTLWLRIATHPAFLPNLEPAP